MNKNATYDSKSEEKLAKQEALKHEFEELRRVGQVPFNGHLDQKYIAFDLTVLKR